VTGDERRSARLLFPELVDNEITDVDLERSEVRRAVRSARVPPAPLRVAQRVALRRGRLGYEEDCVPAFTAARRAVLADLAPGPPRVLVRVDEFPHARAFDLPDRYGLERFERFHAVLRDAGVPYLLAVTPVLSHDYLNPSADGGRPMTDEEGALVGRLLDEGVTVALHGLDHRTRDPRARRHSELAGLSAAALGERLDRALEPLAALGITPRVFVPPFNRFDADQYELLAARFDVVCGGPETVALLGYHRTPLWRRTAVYLPSYAPLYGRAAEVLPAIERLAAGRASLWVPVTLHWGWEADEGWSALERLAAAIGPHTASWEHFLAGIQAAA
jgi:peptidoglycan/xylan/chitin deacetylase (PgdA/CDA1 family)